MRVLVGLSGEGKGGYANRRGSGCEFAVTKEKARVEFCGQRRGGSIRREGKGPISKGGGKKAEIFRMGKGKDSN